MKKLTTFFIFIAVLNASAISQNVTGNAFIKGNYVEVGINQCGGWGTTANAPAGYHARSGILPTQIGDNQLNLGFVADPDRNGWTIGFPNRYNGDYFMPQAPYVGWGVTVNGSVYGTERTNSSAFACGSLNGAIPFAGTAGLVVTTPTSMQATWQGINSGLLVKKIVTVKTNDLYFTVKVVLRNVTVNPLNNIFYGEYVNPDNDNYYQDVATNNLLTTNSIVSQPPTGAALVQALGAITGSYLGLGSRDCRARVFRGNLAYPFGNVSDWYNANPIANINPTGADALPNNLCVGIAFNIGTILPNDSTSFLYTYILKSTDFLPALTETDPELYNNATLYQSGDTIKPCANTVQHLDIASGDFNTWSWSPATGLNTTTGIHVIATIGNTPITYTATGTGACGVKTITITYDPVIKPTLGSDQTINICPGYSADLTTVFNTTGLTTFWTSAGIPVANPAAVSAGTYQLIAFSANNCSSDTALVTVGNFIKPNLGADKTIYSCPGFFSDLTTQFVTTGLTTNWTVGGNPVANPSAAGAGIYQLIATSTDGCSDTAIVTIIDYLKPDLGSDVTLAVCPGIQTNLTTLFVTTGLVTDWTSGGIPVPNPASVGAGNYQLIATNTDGCKDTALVTITNNPKPNLGVDLNISVCLGSTADLTSLFNTTGLTTSWTNSGNPVPNPASVGAGTYQLIATNNFGCSDTALAIINLTPKPDLGPDQTRSVCLGFFIDLTTIFNTSGLTVNWTSAGSPVPNPSAAGAGIYQLIVTNGPGCRDTALVTINNFPKPNLGPDVTLAVCPGSLSNLTTIFVTTGLVTNWTSAGNPVPNPAAAGAGTYQLIATNTDGCKDTALVIINNNPRPNLGADLNISICPGSAVDLTILFNTTGLTTNWTSAGNPVPNPAAVGAGIYQLIATNNFGCTDTALATITLNPKPNLGPDKTIGVCPGILTDLTTQFNTTGLTSSWTIGGTPVINPTAVNIGTYQLIATNTNGCSDTALATIFNFPKPNLGADKNVFTCPGTPVNLTTQFNTAGLTTSWTSGGLPVTNPLSVAAGVYQLIVFNSNSCSDTALLTVNNYPKPNLGSDKTINTCPGFAVNITTLYNTTGLTTQWSTPNPTSVNAGVYTLYVTNSSGCRDTAIVTVTNFPKPNLGSDKTVNICPGQTADLTGLYITTGLTTQWNTTTPGSVTAGVYTLIVTNNNGCSDTAIVTVQQYPLINLNISVIPAVNTILEGETVKFIANGINIVSYSWMPSLYLSSGSSATVIATPLQTTTYKLVVTNNGSCLDSASVNIKVLPLFLEPSGAFTPNGDGYTDKWIIKNIQFTKQNRVAVFNRWGNKVFEATNYQNNWDGKSKNGPLPDGAYYYQIQATTINNRVINLTGSITLLR